jgi:hypothetical protein
LLQCKSMQKQFASSNTFVLRQTLSISSCDGLCTDQNDTAASVHLRDDIAVVCSKLSQTSQYQTPNAKQVVLSNATERSDLSITTAQRTPVRSTPLFHLSAKHRSNESMTTFLFNTRVRANHQVVRSRNHAEITQQIFCGSNLLSGTNTQQHLKSALHAMIFLSLLAAMLAAVKTPL